MSRKKLFEKEQSNIGKLGEKVALLYLKKNQYKIIQSNFYNRKGKRLGEIDIIAQKNNKIIFIEVKSRLIKNAFNFYILPEENINVNKIHRLQKIIHYYLFQTQQENIPWQLDAISVWISFEKNISNKIKNHFLNQNNIYYMPIRSFLFKKTKAHCWVKHLKSIFI